MAENSIFDLKEIQNQLTLLSGQGKKVLLLNSIDGLEVISIEEFKERLINNVNALDNLIKIQAYDEFDNPQLSEDMVLAFSQKAGKFVPKDFFSKIEVREDDPPYNELFDGKVWIRGDLLDKSF